MLSFSSPLHAQLEARHILEIEKTPQVETVLLQHPEIMVVQELNNSFLGIVADQTLPELSGLGLRYRPLDSAANPRDRWFLVRLRQLEQVSQFNQYGNIVPLEGQSALFRAFDSRHPSQFLPQGYLGIKRLQDPIRIEPPPLPGDEAQGDRYSLRVIPEITEMTKAVSSTNQASTIRALQSFVTRDATTRGCIRAGRYLHDTLAGYGLQTQYDRFYFEGNSSRNVIGYLPGKIDPASTVVISAHYDSYAEPGSRAPGADDNASGVAAVLEAARIMSGYSFAYSIKFVLFSAEEWGLYGSAHFAADAARRGEKIVGVINMDMISYADALPEDLDVIVNGKSGWMQDLLASAAQNYSTLNVSTTLDSSFDYSDHSSFWDKGFPAVLCIEDYEDTNPYYHTGDDRMRTINLKFVREVTRVCLAATAQLARTTEGAGVRSVESH